MEIRPIVIPRNVIREIPPPSIRETPPPVVSTLERPVIDVPSVVIEYPTLDAPTQEQFEGMIQSPTPVPAEPADPDRTLPPLPPTGPSIDVGGVTVDLPPLDVVATTGATAVIATVTTLVAGMLVKKSLGWIGDLFKKKKFKVKVKKVTPVIQYVLNSHGNVDIFEHSKTGTKLVDSVDNVESYIRDQIELDEFYETVNKVIVDDGLKDKFTQEGQKRFKSLFLSPAKLAKKLSAKLSI